MKKKKIENECSHYWIYESAHIDDDAIPSRRCKTCGDSGDIPQTNALSLWNGMGGSKLLYGYKGGRPKGSRK